MSIEVTFPDGSVREFDRPPTGLEINLPGAERIVDLLNPVIQILNAEGVIAGFDELFFVLESALDIIKAEGIDVSLQRIRWEYETGLITLLHRVIPANFQELLEIGGDRGKELVDTWIERILHKLEKVDVENLLQDIPA